MYGQPPEPFSVFVYGTLRRGQFRESCWPHRPIGIEESFVRAELYDLGPYPAIVSGTDMVFGERWDFLPDVIAPTLRILDAIEGFVDGAAGNLYERSVVPVFARPNLAAAESKKAYAYWMHAERLPRGAKRIRNNYTQPGWEYSVSRWPEFDRPPEETSLLPEPFGDSY